MVQHWTERKDSFFVLGAGYIQCKSKTDTRDILNRIFSKTNKIQIKISGKLVYAE